MAPGTYERGKERRKASSVIKEVKSQASKGHRVTGEGSKRQKKAIDRMGATEATELGCQVFKGSDGT